ncbi:Alpha/Beta hydrolase fold containing protein [Parasponia andersonii]|uniref:Alpha/Beta hydrolase fold containing protein n=1 Tax=Parasponia andersonii TaxID=3476 RepID=A0A2P5AL15_PARAD|nr:Alpha/Beta hydrolase fold containing protein [Parasponia andersonii]
MITLSLSPLCMFFTVLPLITSIKHETGLARAPPTCFPRVCSSVTYPPKTVSYKYRSASEPAAVDAAKLRAEFLRVLCSRRSGQVPLSVEPAIPVTKNPLLIQEASPPRFSEVCMHGLLVLLTLPSYSVVAPIIGVQGFQWAIDNDKWQARVDSIKPVFEETQIDLGKSVIDKEVVEKVWDRIAPGLVSKFDSPYSIPAIAPRPLLILNGAEDPRCPLPGLEVPNSRSHKAYE